MKTKKLIKKAFKTPELFSAGELAFFRTWLEHKKQRKAARMLVDKECNS